MKSFAYILLAVTVIFAIISGCSKEHSYEKSNPVLVSSWSFSEAGNSFKGKVDSAYLDTLTNIIFLYIDGTADNGTDKLTLAVYGTTINSATYVSPKAFITYVQNNKVIYESDANKTDFSVNITDIDTASVSGTFSGKVMDGNGVEVTITNGKFSSPLKKGTIGTIPTGNLTVWSQASCNFNDPVEVIINSEKDFISTFTPDAPECGTAGAANFTLPAGLYSVQIVCDEDTSTFNDVLVLPNTCNKMQVLF